MSFCYAMRHSIRRRREGDSSRDRLRVFAQESIKLAETSYSGAREEMKNDAEDG